MEKNQYFSMLHIFTHFYKSKKQSKGFLELPQKPSEAKSSFSRGKPLYLPSNHISNKTNIFYHLQKTIIPKSFFINEYFEIHSLIKTISQLLYNA